MRVLLAEDDKTLATSLCKALEKRGYGVDWVEDGETALYSAKELEYMAMILDVHLPKMSGIDVITRLRQQNNRIPVLMLTARDAPAQKVQGLDSGADDYMIKPFDLEELLARLRSLQRRSHGRTETVLKSGDVELDPAGMVARKAGAPVLLTAKEYRILRILMERAGRYVTKSDISYALYSAEDVSESNTIEVSIYSLRKKFGNGFIHTIRGVGYMVGETHVR
ncbi:MAG: response regulator [Alphaproteobacteria bacterium]|nr:response regulator [Alphaproteobacteria bacterium]